MNKSHCSILIILLCFSVSASAQVSQKPSVLVPSPAHYESLGNDMLEASHFEYSLEKGLNASIMPVFLEELATLGLSSGKEQNGRGVIIRCSLAKSLEPEAYELRIDKDITIKAGSSRALAYATTTLIQLITISGGKANLPKVKIKDRPTYAYRGVMIDLGRQWHDLPTIKSIIRLCRFYKIPYLQLHLTDRELFTFASELYPQLTAGHKSYSKAQLLALVEFADARGVTLIPELDLPGHSTAMRKAMPSVFGDESLQVIDISNPKTIEAVKKLTTEIADIFKSSPYFHIGCDEADLKPLEKLPTTTALLKKRGFDNVHDLFLAYIVEMHHHIKHLGKTTVIWESFAGKGSRRVQIPDDILVIAWETLYQRPDSLLENGYTIVNASWKPLYITPRQRWTAKQLHEDWNPYIWASWWDKAPSFYPITIEPNPKVIGAQLCSWELFDYMEVPELKERIPYFTEKLWQAQTNSFAEMKDNVDQHAKKLDRLIFPAELKVNGIQPSIFKGYEHTENTFLDVISLNIVPFQLEDYAVYTVDGSLPDIHGKVVDEPLHFQQDTDLKIAIFSKEGQWKGYYHNYFKQVDCSFEILDDYEIVENPNIEQAPNIVISRPTDIIIKTSLKKDFEYKITSESGSKTFAINGTTNKITVDSPCTIEVYAKGEQEFYTLKVQKK